MTVRTAEVFLKYANWDENNVEENKGYFEKVSIYKDNADQMAADLPDFERNDVIKMLDDAIATLTQINNGDIFRTPSPNPDWADVTLDGDQLTYNNKPVFLADYTWKPGVPELDEFHGQVDGFFIRPGYVIDESGAINNNVKRDLQNKGNGKAGFIFIANTAPPQWAMDNHGDDFDDYGGEPFHYYDIDNPGAREMMSMLFAGTVPYMAGKNYSKLGYMLANEPRWITYKNGTKKVWYNVSVSDYTKEKFKTWLENKHGSIANLNTIWGTNFTNFGNVTIDVPIDISLRGTPRWYDWTTFNDDRVIEWFTYLKSELRKHDPAAKAHLKIMPSFFTDNDPCTGIDLEALTELSDINGNDCAAHYNYIRNGEADWEEKYILGWREMYMGYDFLKSVNPNQINFNTESHLLSTGYTRDLYMNTKYVRAVYWAAHTLGLNVSQTWYWPRKEDGSLRPNLTNAYGGSNTQQPRVTNELHSTIIDLNAYSEEVMAMQRQRKSIRIFYSKTSANQKTEYMDDIFELYEALNFDGISLGFATKNIIKKQNNNNWDVILVHKTEQVTQLELDALQSYLDNGGTIIVDGESLKKNEYGISLSSLNPADGTLVVASSLNDMKTKALEVLEDKNLLAEVKITETDSAGFKGCTWKCIKNSDGNNVLSIINLGKTEASLNIELKGATKGTSCKDLLKGIQVSSNPKLKPYEVLFIEVTDAQANVSSGIFNSNVNSRAKAKLFPNPSTGEFHLDLKDHYDQVSLDVYNLSGMLVSAENYSDVRKITHHIKEQPQGSYLVKLNTDQEVKSFVLMKTTY